MEKLIYNPIAYQSVEFTPQGFPPPIGPGPFYITQELLTTVYLKKNFNLLKGFILDYSDETFYEGTYIDTFKIDGKEVFPRYLPAKIFKTGSSLGYQKKFIPLNFPIDGGKLEIKFEKPANGVTAFASTQKFNILFKLGNTKDESDFYKDYYKYDVIPFTVNNPFETVKFDIRPKFEVKKLIGVTATTSFNNSSIIVPDPLLDYQIGKLSVQINNRKSNPVLLPMFDRPFGKIKTTHAFVELNEEITKSSVIKGYFQDTQAQSTIGLYPYNGVIILKYSI